MFSLFFKWQRNLKEPLFYALFPFLFPLIFQRVRIFSFGEGQLFLELQKNGNFSIHCDFFSLVSLQFSHLVALKIKEC